MPGCEPSPPGCFSRSTRSSSGTARDDSPPVANPAQRRRDNKNYTDVGRVLYREPLSLRARTAGPYMKQSCIETYARKRRDVSPGRPRDPVIPLTHTSLRPAVAFICARSDVYSFRPNEVTDPAFADALREARAAGVVVVAYSCKVSAARITLADRLPVYLGRRRAEDAASAQR